MKCYHQQSVQVLVGAVEKATDAFVAKGTEIAKESTELRKEMLEAVEKTRSDGENMSHTAHEFADDPCSSIKVRL